MAMLTLIRPDLPLPAVFVADNYRLRPCQPADIDDLGELYFDSYDPGEASASLAEARADIAAAFAGKYGRLSPEASLVAISADQQVIGAIQIVERAPWPDTPDCPFAIELFTARAHRRQGVARSLLVAALHVLAQAGQPQLALRVAADNDGAQRLYRSLGFHDWSGPADTPRVETPPC